MFEHSQFEFFSHVMCKLFIDTALNYPLDQAEAKEARQNIAKHVQTELVSDQHNSEVGDFLPLRSTPL